MSGLYVDNGKRTWKLLEWVIWGLGLRGFGVKGFRGAGSKGLRMFKGLGIEDFRFGGLGV